MNSVVMSIRGLPSLELWVPTLPVVPVGSGGSGGSGDSEIVGFDWSYQSRIRKWYFVMYTHRVTSASVCALAGMCSYPWVNPCGYGYGYPPAYPSENPYPYGGYRFLLSTGTGTAPDTRGLPVLLPS